MVDGSSPRSLANTKRMIRFMCCGLGNSWSLWMKTGSPLVPAKSDALSVRVRFVAARRSFAMRLETWANTTRHSATSQGYGRFDRFKAELDLSSHCQMEKEFRTFTGIT